MSEKGRYLYGIVASSETASLGNIGLDGHEVLCVPYKNIAAIVHDCEALPYSSDDKEIVKKWILSHHEVVDKAWERYDVIVPAAFDTIIKGGAEGLKAWLSDNYDSFVLKLTKFAKKAEYGIQVFWDIKKISEGIIQQSEDTTQLQAQIQASPPGTAYLYKRKLEQILKIKLEEKALVFFKEFYDSIKGSTDDIVVEKLKADSDNHQMLVNISCLIPKNDEQLIGKLLDEISKIDGYEARFIGPWPPYSFVNKY